MPGLLLLADPPVAGGSWVVTVILAVLSTGVGGALVAFLRLRKEGPKIIVEAAQGAVVVQSGVIDDLREQIDSLRTRLSEADALQRRVRELERREEELTVENTRLRSQVSNLQARIVQLEGRPA